MHEIGLFPLSLVLVPGERVPLHIFEERYKELIAECLDSSKPFGLVMADDDGIRAIGTEAWVIDVVTRFDDGRLDIIIEGRERVTVLELTEGRSFLTAEVEALHDDETDADPDEVEACMEAFERLVEEAGVDMEPIDPAQLLSWQIAARINFGSNPKQLLLESTSEADRVQSLLPMLELAFEEVQKRAIQEHSAGNGHVKEWPENPH
jgi:ATP-dependent Lon protease